MNKKVIESLAKMLKLDVEEMTKAINTEEDVEFELPKNLKIFTEDEYNSVIESIKDNHGKTRYDAGKLAGNEMTLKDMSEKIGLENPIKNIDDYISTFKTNILNDAGKEPNKKILDLEESLGKVQSLLSDKENELLSIQNSYKEKETKLQAQSYFPDLPENIGLTKSEATSLYFLSHEQREDGIYRNGERQKDDHEKPFDIKKSIEAFVSEKKWNATPSGRGGGAGGEGGDSSGKPKTMEEYESYIQTNGINPASVEANALLQNMVETSNN